LQNNIFLESEGDNWNLRYEKNYSSRISPSRKLLTKWCEPIKKDINKILEIGSGNGLGLYYISNNIQAKANGIEPSKEGINLWKKKYSNDFENSHIVTLQKGTSESLPYEDDSFDLVIFGFCLYLVDRNLLFKSISEADRVLRDGGYLAIEDFDPSKIMMNKYRHYEGINSYKTNYSKIFLASDHYALMHKYSYSEGVSNDLNFNFNKDMNNRVSLSLLYKQENSIYENFDNSI